MKKIYRSINDQKVNGQEFLEGLSFWYHMDDRPNLNSKKWTNNLPPGLTAEQKKGTKKVPNK